MKGDRNYATGLEPAKPRESVSQNILGVVGSILDEEWCSLPTMKLPGSSWFPRASGVRSWDSCITPLKLGTSGSGKRPTESEPIITGPDKQEILRDDAGNVMFVRPGRNQTRPHEPK